MAADTFTVVQISDLHVDPAKPATVQRADEALDLVARCRPDVIVATGDLSANGHICDGHFETVAARFKACPAPVHVIPGNHDVGEPGGRQRITNAFIDRFKGVFGDDRFCSRRDGWTLIGINTQRIGSGLDAEQEQLDWLDEQLDRAESDGQRVALFMHQPAYLRHPDDAFHDHSDYWAVGLPDRMDLLKRLTRPHVRLWASGHLHWNNVEADADRTRVWCPAISIIVDDAKFPPGGDTLGVIVYRFHDDAIDVELVELDVPADVYLFRRPKIALPGSGFTDDPTSIGHVVLSSRSLLSDRGRLSGGLAYKLATLADSIRVTVLTSDGSADIPADAELPVTVSIARNGPEKAACVERLQAQCGGAVVAIGSIDDDLPMLETARIGIALADDKLARTANLAVERIDDAMAMLLDLTRLESALREWHGGADK